MRKIQLILVLLAAAGAACSSAPPSRSPAAETAMTGAAGPDAANARTESAAPAQARRPSTPPYIAGDPAALFVVLPPAPKKGDARDQADRRIFRETRKLAGTPRWKMAAEDAELGNATMLKHFACSLDIELTAQQAPKVVALVQKVTRESAAAMSKAKDFYKRARPFNVDRGETCVPGSTVGKSYDYPSGHTTAGWAWGLVLAQVDPQRATPILARGRAIGDSRVVCGMHNASAVEGARMLTGAAVALVNASPLYQSDLAAAREELAALRAGAHTRPDPAQCAIENELVKPYW